MAMSDPPAEPPYRRIVAILRQRILSGELAPGDRVPSTRHIMQEFGVAMATATKVLTTLRQEELVRAEPGVGTVVVDLRSAQNTPRAVRHRRPRGNDNEITTERIVRAAMEIADAEGLDALSLRRVAADLDIATMTLYRYVEGKEDLILLMAEAAFAETPLPEQPPEHWREHLELACRLQWTIHRLHPWLVQVMSLTRPRPAPNAMAHTEWALRALDGLHLDPVKMLYIHITLVSYVRGFAINFELEAEAEQNTGMTDEQWLRSQDANVMSILASGAYPILARTMPDLSTTFSLDHLFEFGLSRVLDGIGVLIAEQRPPAGPR